MGCWNGTCAMSKLPIFHGDRVVCWFIVETQGYSRGDATNFCYPHDKYQLMAMPFRAEYNDYGGVEDVDPADQEMLNLLVSTLRVKLVEHEVGENKSHDIAVKRDALDFDLVQEAIHEGRLQIDGYGEPKSVGMIMILESVFNKMVTDYRWEERSYPEGYNKPAVKTIRQYDLDEMAKQLQTAVEKDTEGGMLFFNETDRYVRDIYGITFIIRDLFKNKIPLEHPLFQQVFRGMSETRVLVAFAYNLRMHFGPQSGGGSQQGDLEPYEMLIEAMQHAIKIRKDEVASW